MKWVGFILISFLLLLLLVSLSRIQVQIVARSAGSNHYLFITIHALYGLLRWRREVPIISLEETLHGFSLHFGGMDQEGPLANQAPEEATFTSPYVKRKWLDWKELLKNYIDLLPIFKRFLRLIWIVKLDWRTSIGTGEAAETGILTGFVWSMKALLLTFLSQTLTLQTEPHYQVHAHYSEQLFHSEGECILQISVGKAMIVAIKAFISLRKGRERRWQNIQSKA